MALTDKEITAGASYTVRLDRGLSAKRGNDARQLVKRINGMRDEFIYDPQDPAANAITGYVRNDDPTAATAEYDTVTGTWAVTLPARASSALSALRNLVSGYSATVTPAAAGDAAPAPQLTYKRTGQGEWVVLGPVSLMHAGLVTVTKRDGGAKTEMIDHLGKPFDVRGVQYCYGYIAAPEPGRRRARNGFDMNEYGSGFGPDEGF